MRSRTSASGSFLLAANVVSMARCMAVFPRTAFGAISIRCSRACRAFPADAAPAWCKIQQAARFLDHHPVPHSAWHNKGLPGFQRKTAFASFLVENYVDCTLDQVEQFVAVRMHLAGMRRVPGHSGLTRESALDTGMSATSLSDCFDRSGGCETNRILRQVDRILEWLRHRLGFHAACSHVSRSQESSTNHSCIVAPMLSRSN